MIRLDRARIALAYEYLRGVRWGRGFGSSFYEGACEFALDAALHSAPPGVSTQARPYFRTHVPARVLRARLALYLRALMRADVGDFGPWWRRIRPLWESAPAHRGTV